MIKIIDGDLFNSKANFIVHQVNCQGVMGSGLALQVAQKYPHVKKEYIKYVKHCNKNKIKMLGTVQYIPVDTWAMVMVDTFQNKNVEAYDSQYQYVVNLFGQDNYGYDKQYTDLNAVRTAFNNICINAQKLNATVALPFNMGSCRGGAKWNDIYKIIQDVFGDKVNVEIWKCNKG